jgi:hypothetical protein
MGELHVSTKHAVVRALAALLVAVLLVTAAGAQSEFIAAAEPARRRRPADSGSDGEEGRLLHRVQAEGFAGWHPVNREMLVATRARNSTQMHRLAAPMGKLEQLTDFPDPVRVASFEPKNGAYLVFSKDIGGSEQTQVFRLDLDKATNTQLTDRTCCTTPANGTTRATG